MTEFDRGMVSKIAKKILIVEDEPLMLAALSDKFRQAGFAVIQAANGQEGLSAALREHPDLLLIDILMPVLDGIAMVKLLRQDPWGKTAKVILLTQLSDSEKMAEALEKGAYDYLIKTDWNLDEVVAKVKERMSQ